MIELAVKLALFVSRPFYEGWQVWGKPYYRARGVVVFDRCLVTATKRFEGKA